MAGEEEEVEKYRDMEREGKAMDTNTGGSPVYQSQPSILETHLVRKLGDTGLQRVLSPRMNGWIECSLIKYVVHSQCNAILLLHFKKAVCCIDLHVCCI